MNQRAISRRRPSGTDGSDFSYHMVIDSSTLSSSPFPSTPMFHLNLLKFNYCELSGRIHKSCKGKVPSRQIDLRSGRKRSRSYLLKFYAFGSLMLILLSVAHLAMSNLSLETFQNFTSLDTLKVVVVLLGFVVQLFAIGTTISLINNIAPPKRAL
ncbi:hypothetical protein MTR67_013629 [Solanum verrucosum]|uniref:Uncharacterized protein n=1 Tax=Solanum verrucosum TaxID=315347 RepID=A0AAF0TIL2_SOLVR|nr:hypothetical protein MTR67_013629 [Solanum verrucosum]